MTAAEAIEQFGVAKETLDDAYAEILAVLADNAKTIADLRAQISRDPRTQRMK